MLNRLVLDSRFDRTVRDHLKPNAETKISDIVKAFVEQDQSEVRFASC
jgi:hypothetical protein